MDGNISSNGVSIVWFALALLVIVAPPEAHLPTVSAARTVPNDSSPTNTSALQCGTSNFHVRSASNRLLANEVAERCEELRGNLQRQWLARQPQQKWTPVCEVILHATKSSYLSAVGAEAANTTGCTSVRVDQGRVLLRRIDVCAENVERALSALSHELTHVVLTDRFGQQPLPRWADEGIATLTDHVDKQQRHHLELLQARARGGMFRIGELLATEDYPASHRMAAFYGQSTSLVRFLVEKKTPADFIRFIEKGRSSGYDAALRDIYEIQGVADLDNQWRAYAPTAAAHPVASKNVALLNFDVLVTLAKE